MRNNKNVKISKNKKMSDAVKTLREVSDKFTQETYENVFTDKEYYNKNMGLSMTQMSRSIANGKWYKLLRYAERHHNYYYTVIYNCIADMATTGQQVEDISALSKVKKYFAAIGKSPYWPKIEQIIREKLIEQKETEETIQATLKRVQQISGQTITKRYEKVVDRSLARAEMALDRNLPALVEALSAFCVAYFNLLCGKDFRKVNFAIARQWCKSTKQTIDSFYKKLHKLLTRKQLEKLPAIAAKIRQEVYITVVNGVHCTTVLHNQTISPDGKSPEETYRLGCATGDILRHCSKLYALSYILNAIAANPHSRMAAIWMKSAAGIGYVPQKPATPISLTDLRGKKNIKNGSQQTILARVNDVVIIYHGETYISFAHLEDGKGNFLTAVLPYAKIESVGIDPGCSVCLSGIYMKSIEKYLFDVPQQFSGRVARFSDDCLIVDRLNTTELQNHNWLYWLDNHLKPYFIAVPHGLAASWSWLPGPKGAGNPLRFMNWFDMKANHYAPLRSKTEHSAAVHSALVAEETLLIDAAQGDMDNFPADLVKSLIAENDLVNLSPKGVSGGEKGGRDWPPDEPGADNDWDPGESADNPSEPQKEKWPDDLKPCEEGPDVPPDEPDDPDWPPPEDQFPKAPLDEFGEIPWYDPGGDEESFPRLPEDPFGDPIEWDDFGEN
jgi:hypothetical protein